MALTDDVARLAEELQQGSECITTEINTFPSGAVSLLVRANGRAFEIVYLPGEGMFGVDELEADAGFDSGYRFAFSDFASARAKLLVLLDEAKVAPAFER